jgi:carboxymethylenebutenolidase
MAHKVLTVPVQSNAMEVFYFEPKGEGPHPGIVLCQHIPVAHAGIEKDPVTIKMAERYCEQGYAVAVPFFFHWWAKDADMEMKRNAFRDDWTRMDLDAAFGLLASQPGVNRRRIGIVGHCWGGRIAWLGAATNKAYRACAIFYGGRIKLPMGPGTPPAIDRATDIKCPVIGFFGNEDTNPTPAEVDDYDKALTAAGVEHTFHRYDGAGHGFQTFSIPERYREKQSEDAWVKVLDFLAAKLERP